VNDDWFVTNGGDGFWSAIDPIDPNIVYAESQYGYMVRYDRKSGESISIRPQPRKGEYTYRWNWNTPLVVSKHVPTRIYTAANKLFRSDDRGNTWQVISDDLTRQIDRNRIPVMGKVWSVDAVAKNALYVSLYFTITPATKKGFEKEFLNSWQKMKTCFTLVQMTDLFKLPKMGAGIGAKLKNSQPFRKPPMSATFWLPNIMLM